jgi:predicted kinase
MIDTSKETLIIATGIPGCGKSTWFTEGIKNGYLPKQSVRINMDDIRYQLTGNASDQSMNDKVASLASSKLKECVSNKVPVIYWDNTTITKKYRKQIIETAKKANYNIICVYFDIPLQTCKDRNKGRSRVVPEHVLDNMYNNLQNNIPHENEGFGDIIIINQ